MPFDRQRRLVFLHIPKTAGSSIEQALGLFGPWDQQNLATGFGLIQSRDLLARKLSSNFLQHLSLNELEALFPDALADAQLFTVVRDPWQRLLSSFRNPDPDLANYYRYRTNHELSPLSLADYIDVARWLPHPHLKPQLSLVAAADRECPDLARVFHQKPGRARNLAQPALSSRSSCCSTQPAGPYLSFSGRVDSAEQQVRWLYAADAHAFGYTNPSPLFRTRRAMRCSVVGAQKSAPPGCSKSQQCAACLGEGHFIDRRCCPSPPHSELQQPDGARHRAGLRGEVSTTRSR